MKKILDIIQKKTPIDAFISLIYFVIVGLLKWRLMPQPTTLYFFTGAAIGIYFLEIAEELFHLEPSPFRSIVFGVGLVIVSLFVITSTASMLGAGLVLSLSLSLILWQWHEWQKAGNLNSWYIMISSPVTFDLQRLIFAGFTVLLLIETFLFLR